MRTHSVSLLKALGLRTAVVNIMNKWEGKQVDAGTDDKDSGRLQGFSEVQQTGTLLLGITK